MSLNLKNILISTIVRNREPFLKNWISQLNDVCKSRPEINFYLSVYENDSIDGSKEILQSLDYSYFKQFKIISENLDTPFFGSVQNSLRVKLLAEARNKSLFENEFLEKCDWVLSVEPDVKYNAEDVLRIIDNDDYDILSGRSMEITSTSNPTYLYDVWATRNTSNHSHWLSNIEFNKIIETWSTYNCFCKYNAEPIKNKIAFDYRNKRLGRDDCDTAVICENFRENGYSKIALDGTVNIFHMR